MIYLPEYKSEPLLEMFIFETSQLLEQFEQVIINSEKLECYELEAINEIFRIMHTIKGSSAMMHYDNISTLAHSVEDLFYFLRKEKSLNVYCTNLSDIVLECVDFIKTELQKIENGKNPDKDASSLVDKNKDFLEKLKATCSNYSIDPKIEEQAESDKIQNSNPHKTELNISGSTFSASGNMNYKAVIYFTEGCEMENVRAYALIHSLKDIAEDISYIPAQITEDDNSIEIIRKEGFQIWFETDHTFEEMHNFFSQTIFLKDLELVELGCNSFGAVKELKGNEKIQNKVNEEMTGNTIGEISKAAAEPGEKIREEDSHLLSTHQSIISVNITKLDKLMDLVGELVISEAMVTQNHDLEGLMLGNFQKAANQHRKIINELQDVAMSIRMVPLSSTFQKMNRIIRDMSKKLNKDVRLEIIGEETEVDKNIIEHISDPLMHLIRNAVDHGIESACGRKAKGKNENGTVTLEAKNAGGDVLIIVKDDGQGLNKEKILARARENGFINKPENELLDKEIYSYIFLPGFSTKDEATEFSGRGVGMDVVTKNISAIGGSVSVDSVPEEGTAITLKIPLTLAIMDGMTISVGRSKYTIPIISIRESFKVKEGEVFTDPEGNEMIMIRGECYSIIRLHELYNVKTDITNIPDGIVVMVENESKSSCIFADKLLGEQQVVVKALPEFIKNIKKVRGVAGCTLLGDGSISLILDIAGLIETKLEGR